MNQFCRVSNAQCNPQQLPAMPAHAARISSSRFRTCYVQHARMQAAHEPGISSFLLSLCRLARHNADQAGNQAGNQGGVPNNPLQTALPATTTAMMGPASTAPTLRWRRPQRYLEPTCADPTRSGPRLQSGPGERTGWRPHRPHRRPPHGLAPPQMIKQEATRVPGLAAAL